MDEIDEHVSGVIRERRIAIRMSQPALAKAIGVTFQQVQKYENGTTRITAGRLHLIAGALGVTVQELFPTGENEGTSSSSLGTGDAQRLAKALGRVRDARSRVALIELVEAAADALQRP